MKIKGILLLTITLLVGCTSTRFSEFRGQGVMEGRGGTVRNVKGIDIWDTGEPNRKYEIIGLLHQNMIQRNPNLLAQSMNASISESSLIAQAKKQGGDAIIFISSSSQLAGAYTTGSGPTASYGGYSTYNAHTTFTTLAQTQVAVVRYIK